ncbi:MAG: 4-hydroxy-tetrahydrodipicolinate reductase, partial [Nitrospirae bacterium]|nr:4-hydroxy-tetrahydrodipicolinate reductase [Nitrospirota bacterium]
MTRGSSSQPVRVVIMGASGKMGARLIALAIEMPGLAVGAAMERAGHPSLGRDAGEAAGAEPIGVVIGDDVRAALSAGDVVIDFTTPAATLVLLPHVVDAKLSLVIGTTGMDASGVEAIRAASFRIPIVFAPNMSLGMNVMFKVVADVARALGAGYDVEIVEAHHRQKKDAPSGTALALGRA